MRCLTFCLLILLFSAQSIWAAGSKLAAISADPYRSALVVNADTGETLFAENADAQVYPASVLKLMVLLVVLDRIAQGQFQLADMVQVTDEAYRTGGSQVYLDPREQFPVEELLYALIVQSANDAAVALATHVAGSKEGFVRLMNVKAQELGMKDTHFASVHGLPPSEGQEVDVSTANDLALLCRELVRRPEALKYTATRVRDFREGKMVMRNHNHLLDEVIGCDGLKTGYFKAAGFSVAATAVRDGVRLIALVMGSKDRKVRDAKAGELLAQEFAKMPPGAVAGGTGTVQMVQTSPPGAENPEAVVLPSEEEQDDVAAPPAENAGETAIPSREGGGGWGMFFAGMATGIAVCFGYAYWKKRKQASSANRYLRR